MGHHTQEPSEELRAHMLDELKELKEEFGDLGPTGRFPEGKIVPEDKGEIRFAVGVVKGKIVIDFGSSVHSVGMNRDQALGLAELLIQRAREC